MLSVAVILGTRPEAVKLFPVIDLLRRDRTSYRVTTIASGQHRGVFADTVRALGFFPDLSLDAQKPGQSLGELSANLIADLDIALAKIRPDLVLVQGDTQTALMGALSASFRRIAVAHVEAGLRSGNPEAPFPEELNRKLIARAARLHFAPTERARRNLLAEGVNERDIAVTGNTIIDSLSRFVARQRSVPRKLSASNRRFVLATCHRRESWSGGVDQICDALGDLAFARPDLDILFILPVAPDLRRRIAARLQGIDRIALSDPLPYGAFLTQLMRADLVVTDSGGLQEETAALGIPVVVMRQETDRPEALGSASAVLAGTDRTCILKATQSLLDGPRRLKAKLRPNPFGDGRSARRIALALGRWSAGKCPLLTARESFRG